jgi:hypothetical protein
MLKIMTVLIICGLNIPSSALAASATATKSLEMTATEKAAVMLPLQNYIKGLQTGNSAYMRDAFEKNAKVQGYMGGQFISWNMEEYAARFSGKPAADEAQRERSIELLDITGDVAVGKVVSDYPTVKFTDYMSILKIDGVWKIVAKSFHAEAKTPPKK